MKSMHYIRFDIHKKAISFCEKRIDGTIVDQGIISATRASLTEWLGKGKLHGQVPWKPPCLPGGYMIKYIFINIYKQLGVSSL